MPMRPKTKRRLAVLFGAFLLIIAIGVGAYSFSQNRKEQRAQMALQEGMAAYEAGDYPNALGWLSMYLTHHRDDIDALFAYGRARAEVEEANFRHVPEAIHVFSRVLMIDPGHQEAQDALLDLYSRGGYNAEAIELANRRLAVDPDNVPALRAKAAALNRLTRYQEAMRTVQRLNELEPMDLEGHNLRFQIMVAMQRPGNELVEYAAAMRERHPEDPRFELLQAIAYVYAHQPEEAQKWLRAAADRTPPDAHFVRQLVQTLDGHRMFAEAQSLLERTESTDPEIRQMLVMRLWENNRWQDVVERLGEVEIRTDSDEPALLGYYALALHKTGRSDEALQVADALAERRGEPPAIAWATILRARVGSEYTGPKELAARYGSALTRDPQNSVARYYLAEAYAELGEMELAVREWRRAAEISPGWPAPQASLARTLANSGRIADAIEHARRSYRLAPRQLSSMIALSIAWGGRIGVADQNELHQLLDLVREVQQSVEGGEPETLPIYVTLLARTGQKDSAAQAIQQVLDDPQRYSQHTLLQLAYVSRAEGIGMEDSLLDAAEQAHGVTPLLAEVRAINHRDSGMPREGLRYLQSAAEEAEDASAQWPLVIARYRESIGDDDVLDDWRALAQQHPTNLEVQRAILRARSVRSDRAFMAATIERVRELTGEEALLWKQERARWLLLGGASADREKDLSEATFILNELVQAAPHMLEARRLLAIAFREMDMIDRAVRELDAVVELAPADVEARLSLAQMLTSLGRRQQALGHLDRLATVQWLDHEQRQAVAHLFTQLGETQRAVEVLAGSGFRDLPLAELYRRQGNHQAAEEVYRELLDRDEISAAAIGSAADFFARRGQAEIARAAMKRLDEITLPAGHRELIWARFSERHAELSEAEKHYSAAAEAAPGDATVWRQFLVFQLRHGRLAEAVRLAEQAASANAELQSAPRFIAAAVQHPDDQAIRLLVEEIVRDPGNAAATEAFQAVERARRSETGRERLIRELRELAPRHGDYYPIRRILIHELLADGQAPAAANAAVQAERAFPGLPEPAALATGAFAEARQYNEMLLAAQRWRSRAGDNAVEADLAIADARIRLGQAAVAVDVLAPYFEAAMQDPQANAQVITEYARALLLANRAGEAERVLADLLPQASQWRLQWLRLSRYHRDHGSAMAWVDRAAGLVPEDSLEERLALTEALLLIGHTHDHRPAFTRARQAVEALAQQQDAPQPVLLAAAIAAQQEGDASAAEDYYRRALELEPDPVAQNNLAYLLAEQDRLDEALELAERAVAAASDTAAFHHTLALIHSKLDNRDLAVLSYEQASQHDPRNLGYMIRLADALVLNGDRERALQVLEQIEGMLRTGATVGEGLQEPLQRVREALLRSAAAGQ